MEPLTTRFNKETETSVQTYRDNSFNVEEKPPFIFSFLNAIQIVLCQILNIVWMPLLLTPSLCLLSADPARVQLISTTLFVSGVMTSLQSTLGLRLSSVVSPSPLYTARFLTLLQRPEWQCPTSGDLYAMGPALRAIEWQSRLRELQGVLLLAGGLQMVLGFSGVQAYLCRLFSPIVVASAVIIAGLSVPHYPLNILQDTPFPLFIILAVLFIIFTFWLKGVCMPLPTFSVQNGLTAKSFPVFRMFPVLWVYAAYYFIFYLYNTISSGNKIGLPFPNEQSKAYEEAVDNSKWFIFSFPFEWGPATLSWATVAYMAPVFILQTLTSMVVFYANAQTSSMTPPTKDAVSRGLGLEGVGLVFGAFWGQSATINTANIGLMSFTGIVSRSSTQLSALIMIILSNFTQFISWLADIDVFFLRSCYLCLHIGFLSVGFSALKHTDLSNKRDCLILGFSLFFGLVVPQSIPAPSSDDAIIAHLFTSPLWLSTCCALLMDIILPGKMRNSQRYQTDKDLKTYRLPTWEELLCSVLQNTPFFSSLPNS